MDNHTLDEADSETSQTLSLSLQPSVDSLGLQSIQRHVFLCADQTRAVCCDKTVGLEAPKQIVCGSVNRDRFYWSIPMGSGITLLLLQSLNGLFKNIC
jgi:hypothetical protein